MRTIQFAVQGLAGAMLLLGCAAPSTVNSPRIEPVVSLQHGGAQADGYFELGRFFQGQGRNAQAIVAYRNALGLNDRLAEAHNALGALLAADRDFDKAFAEFRAAIAIDPTAAHFQSNLGYAQYLAGRPAEAAVTLEKAVALDPANAHARNNLGAALAATGESESSRVAFARAAEVAAAPPPSGTPSIAAPIEVRGDTAPVQFASSAWSVETALLSPAKAQTGFARTVPELHAGTIVSEWPAGLSVVEQAPNVLELKWTGTQVLARAAVAGDDSRTRAYGLEVANGNGVAGMARRVGGLLAAVGLPKARLTNQQPYAQTVTEIHFRDGHADAAASLGARLPNHPTATAVPSDRLRADIDVRLVLGRDLPDNVVLIEPALTASRAAELPPRTLPRMN